MMTSQHTPWQPCMMFLLLWDAPAYLGQGRHDNQPPDQHEPSWRSRARSRIDPMWRRFR